VGMKHIFIICDPVKSNSMKSRNPYSGFHVEEYAPCIDTSTQNPIRNGGGGIIVQRKKRVKAG
jgi:hypothetical protein